MNTGIYARISEDRDETQLGVGRQVEDCEHGGAQRGWNVVDRYIDNDISAYTGGRRPEYERMLQDIADGRIDAVIVWHQDRLVRQPRELEHFFDVCDKAGVTHLASVTGDIDLSTHDGRLKARILGAVARNQSDAASRRIQRKAQEIAQAGKPSGGGCRPFGFEDDRVTIRESEAAILRDLAGRLLAGESLRGLCNDLNARGVPTTTGGVWQTQPLRRLLHSGRISGQREHKGEIVAEATWPAIITPSQTRRIRALLDDPTRRATRPNRSYLLTGLLRCGVCGAPLSARPRDDGARRYVCAKGPGLAGRGCVYTLAEPIEELVIEAVMLRYDSPELADKLQGRATESNDALADAIDELTSRLDELANAYARQEIAMREWMVARGPLQRELDDARRRQSRHNGNGVLGEFIGRPGMLRKRWGAQSFDRQNAILKAALSDVLVRPGRRGYNRFDPDRFEFTWGH